jgi:general secretion pathway protein D
MARAAVMALAALAAPPLLAAQQPPPVQAGPEGVTLDFRDTDIRLVISALAEFAGINVTYSNLPATPVTLRSPAPVPRAQVREQLEGLIRSNGLRMVDAGGGLYRVETVPAAPPPTPAPSAAPAAGPGAVPPDGIQLFVYRLRHAQAETIAGTLRDLFGLGALASGGQGREDSGTLSRQLQQSRIPYPGEEAGNQPRPAAGGGVALAGGVSGKVQIVPDASTNSLLIRGNAQDYATILQAVQQLDIRPLQVLIEVMIVEVQRTRNDNTGVKVTIPDQLEPRTGATIGGTLDTETPGNLAIRVLGVGGVRADVIISALASSSDVTILSRPVILAQNNMEARILVGDQRPFVQISRTLPTDNGARDEVVQYRDVGTKLTITPTINADGYVSMEVRQEISSPGPLDPTIKAPIINTREAETRLLVRDRHTAVIGGLISQDRTSGSSGVPVLRDIPLLGALFRSRTESRGSTELFILLTPHVLRTDEDVEEATRSVQDSAREVGRMMERYEPVSGRAEPLRPKP